MPFLNYRENSQATNSVLESETQTSKTILQLAVIELENLSARREIKQCNNEKTCDSPVSPKSRTYQEIYSNRQEFLRNTSPMRNSNLRYSSITKKNICIDTSDMTLANLSHYIIKKIYIKPVTVSPSSNKTRLNLTSNSTSPRSLSPPQKESHDVYEDSDNVKISNDKFKSTVENENSEKEEINTLLTQIKCSDWNVALSALKQIALISDDCSADLIHPHMPEINQRLIQLINSPRSHVCRTSCQIAGHLFQTVGDTRRPEFDDIVDLLLGRTADANRFIKIDANEALSIMVSSISPYHSVRSICNKGTKHKNDLVRMSAVRLFVQIVNVCGANLILGYGGNEFTRKRILSNMFNFINDKNIQVRHYGEELRKLLCQHPNYDFYVKEYGKYYKK